MGEVTYSLRAARDLTRQLDRIRANSPSGARRVLADIEHTAFLLADHLVSGPRVPGSRTSRSFITRRYRYKLVYHVTSDGIEVLDVLHPRQDPSTPR